LRVHIDERNEKVNAKIREHQMQKIPYMLVVGDREAQNNAVSVRHRKHGDQGAKPVAEFLAMAQDLDRRRVTTE
jgi:threonyl-tRNA synthetase